MIRINLLPPEIVERRKWERFYPYIAAGTVILAGIVVVTWGVLSFVVSSSERELQSIEQSTADLRQQAERLAVFELKEQELAARQAVVNGALAGAVDMGRLAEEITLVLPEEVWATNVQCDEDDGVKLNLYAPDPLGQDMSEGYKSAASTLVRLSSLDSLYDVWLGTASVTRFNAFQGIEGDTNDIEALSFDVSAKIRVSADTPATGQ